jgi:2-(1,2-epoxy-1,2-dihydrophenyl)acetyl-CoA isomerase
VTDTQLPADTPLLTTLDDGILTITLNRPHRLNAFTAQMHRLMLEALRDAARDPGVRVIVVTGAGRGFCAGYDVAEGGKPAEGDAIAAKWDGDPKWTSVETIAARLREDAEIPYLLHTMPKITIAAVRGPAAGSGLCLAAACDLRIVSDTAIFKTAFASLGRCGDPGGSYYMSKLIGGAKTREFYLLDEKMDAAAAKEAGLVNMVVADAALDATIAALATKLAHGPTAAYGYIKQNINFAQTATLPEVLTSEALANARASQTHDAQEAVQAFLQKRPAKFQGF